MKTKLAAVCAASLALVACGTTTAFATGGTSGLSAQVVAEKAANGTDIPKLSAADKKILAAKVQWAKAFYAANTASNGTISPKACAAAVRTKPAPQIVTTGSTVTPATVTPLCGGIPTSSTVAANQQGQDYSNYCGPATIHEILGQLGHSVSQAAVAKKIPGLSPNNGGTDVDPFKTVLNSYASGNWDYVRYNVAYTPTSANYSDFEQYLTADLATGYPIGGNAEEVYGGPHLPGHPNETTTIYHWFDIRGYGTSSATGDRVDYEDSATTIWSAVPAYTNSYSSHTLTEIMGGRGFDW